MSKTQENCIAILEQIRWGGKPICPYCSSTNASPMKRERRYHCNTCFVSYSVTVGTVFHRTHVELSKWFQAISLFLEQGERVSIRQLAAKVGVSKNTAAYMLVRLDSATTKELEMLEQLLKAISKFDC